MSELVAEVAKVLQPWPIAEGFFVIVISFLSFMAMRRGERERKNGGASSMEIPMFLMGGPVHDAMGALHDIAEEARMTNTLLRSIIKGLDDSNRNMIQTHKLLEDLRNQTEMRPARR